MNDLTLYSYFRSSTAYRARIALNLKKLTYTYKPVHLLEDGGQQHKPEYLALNPAAGVPTLVHNGRVLSQSFAIIEYLDEMFVQPRLFPTEPYDKARVRQLCESINCEIHPLTNLKVTQFLTRNMGTTAQQNELWQQHWISKGLASLEQLLQQTSGKFAYGDNLTCADLFIIPQVFSAERFGVKIDQFPIIKKINSTCLEMEAFKQAHPLRQPDTPKELAI